MITKLIIVDGMDNTGKSTLITRLTNVLEQLGNTTITIHSQKPPKDIAPEDTAAYQHKYYLDLIDKLVSLKHEHKYDYIILDRGWVSEYVYGPLYRNRSKQEIVEDNIVLDKKVLTEFNLMSSSVVYLIMLLGSTKFLLNHEDGKSLFLIDGKMQSKDNEELIDLERSEFEKGFDYSLIDKKSYFEVDSDNDYIEILPEVCRNILFSH